MSMQRGAFWKTGTQTVYSDVGVPDSALAVSSPLVSVQLADLVK